MPESEFFDLAESWHGNAPLQYVQNCHPLDYILCYDWSQFDHRIENKQKGHSSQNLQSLCPHACCITYVHYAGSGQSIASCGQWKCWTGYSAIILVSQLHKNRGTCCTAEWPYCLFPIQWFDYKLASYEMKEDLFQRAVTKMALLLLSLAKKPTSLIQFKLIYKLIKVRNK